MKVKYASIIFVLGYCCDFIGALWKVMHSPRADTALTIGAVLKVAGALLFLYKLITYSKFREFMNS